MLRFLVVALLATACGRVVAQWSQPDELGQMLGIEEAVTDLEPSWATVTYGDEHTRSLLQYSPSTAPKIRVRYTSLMGIKTVQLDGTLFPTCASLTPSFVAGLKEGYVSAISDDLNTYDAVFASLSVTCFNTDGTSQPLRRRLNQVFPNQVLGIKFQLDADTPVGQETNVLAGITNSVQGGTVTSSTTYFCSCPFLILPLKYLNGDPPTCISSPPEVVTNCPPGQWDGGGDVEILLPNVTIPFQVDSFVDNTLPCGVFWQQSMPRGSKPPNAALRLGLRTVSDAVAGEQGWAKTTNGGVYKILRMSNLCTNPPKSIKGKAKNRKRMRTSITPSLPTGQNGLYLTELKKKVDAGAFKDAAAAWGAGVWAPLPFSYNNGKQAVCAPTVSGSNCAGGWKPRKISPL